MKVVKSSGLKLILITVLLASLAACNTFSNRLACTPANDELYMVSKYMYFGIATVIADEDRAAICVKR